MFQRYTCIIVFAHVCNVLQYLAMRAIWHTCKNIHLQYLYMFMIESTPTAMCSEFLWMKSIRNPKNNTLFYWLWSQSGWRSHYLPLSGCHYNLIFILTSYFPRYEFLQRRCGYVIKARKIHDEEKHRFFFYKVVVRYRAGNYLFRLWIFGLSKHLYVYWIRSHGLRSVNSVSRDVHHCRLKFHW